MLSLYFAASVYLASVYAKPQLPPLLPCATVTVTTVTTVTVTVPDLPPAVSTAVPTIPTSIGVPDASVPVSLPGSSWPSIPSGTLTASVPGTTPTVLPSISSGITVGISSVPVVTVTVTIPHGASPSSSAGGTDGYPHSAWTSHCPWPGCTTTTVTVYPSHPTGGTGVSSTIGNGGGSSPSNTVTKTTGSGTNPTAAPGSQCSTGPVQCCNSVQPAGSPAASTLTGLLGLVLGANVPVGLQCTTLNVLGIGGGSSCNGQTVCCTDNSFGGLIAIGCTPINISL